MACTVCRLLSLECDPLELCLMTPVVIYCLKSEPIFPHLFFLCGRPHFWLITKRMQRSCRLFTWCNSLLLCFSCTSDSSNSFAYIKLYYLFEIICILSSKHRASITSPFGASLKGKVLQLFLVNRYSVLCGSPYRAGLSI